MARPAYRRPRLVNLTPSQQALLEQHKGVINKAEKDSHLLSFGKRYIFPLLDELKKTGVDVTPKLLRATLKEAKHGLLLTPPQARLGKEYAFALIKEWVQFNQSVV